MTTPREYMVSFKARHSPSKKPRVNWKKELKKERERVLSEVVQALRDHQRNVPDNWQDGYNSAVTQVEILK